MNVVPVCIAATLISVLSPVSARAETITATSAGPSPIAAVSVAGLSLASAQALPGFPVNAYRDGYRQGRVVVGYQVNADGRVSDVQVLDAYPVHVFTRTVTKTVADWRFVPTGANERRTVEFRFEGQ